jgi:hypothetical protein
MERFIHFAVPAGNCRVVSTDPVKKVGDDCRIHAWHVACGNEYKVSLRRPGTGMQSADRTDAFSDVSDAADVRKVQKPRTLRRIPRDEDDLTGDTTEGFGNAFDKCPAIKREKIFFLSIRTARFPADQHHRRSHASTPLVANGSVNQTTFTSQLFDIFAATGTPAGPASGINTIMC